MHNPKSKMYCHAVSRTRALRMNRLIAAMPDALMIEGDSKAAEVPVGTVQTDTMLWRTQVTQEPNQWDQDIQTDWLCCQNRDDHRLQWINVAAEGKDLKMNLVVGERQRDGRIHPNVDVYDSLVHVNGIAEALGHHRPGLGTEPACIHALDNSNLALERAWDQEVGLAVGRGLRRALAALLAYTSDGLLAAVAFDRYFEDVDTRSALERTHAPVMILE